MTRLHQTLTKVVHCRTPRRASMSFGSAQSVSGQPLAIVIVSPSRADYPRTHPHTKEGSESAGDAGARNRTTKREEVVGLPLLFPTKREEVASLPLIFFCFLSQCLWVGVIPILPPLFPMMPFPHLACQNADGWERGQAGRTVHLTHCGSSHAEWHMGEAALRAESGPRNP